MIEGLWSAEFQSGAGIEGTGVVVLMNGRILGGDDQYYYLGEYTFDGSLFNAFLDAFAYIADPVSIFGTEERTFRLAISGIAKERIIYARGLETRAPFVAKLTKRADLL